MLEGSETPHALCDNCYASLVDVGVARMDPIRLDLPHAPVERCCSCSIETVSGLYIALPLHVFANCDHERRFAQEGASLRRRHFTSVGANATSHRCE